METEQYVFASWVSELADLKKKMHQVESDREADSQKIATLTRKLEVLQAANEASEKELAAAKAKIMELSKFATASEKELAAAKATITELSKFATALRKKFSSEDGGGDDFKFLSNILGKLCCGLLQMPDPDPVSIEVSKSERAPLAAGSRQPGPGCPNGYWTHNCCSCRRSACVTLCWKPWLT